MSQDLNGTNGAKTPKPPPRKVIIASRYTILQWNYKTKEKESHPVIHIDECHRFGRQYDQQSEYYGELREFTNRS